MNDAPHSAPAPALPAPLALPPAQLAPPPAQLAPPHPSLPPPAQALPLATHLALAHAAAAAAPGGLAFYGLPPPQPGLAPLALPAPSGVTGQPGIPVGMDNAYLSGLTKSGKRRRKHPVAEVKGQWTAEEDERLIRCAVALSVTSNSVPRAQTHPVRTAHLAQHPCTNPRCWLLQLCRDRRGAERNPARARNP